jgi:hypothetical protein
MTGDTLWSSNEAQTPLLIAKDRLYAQAGTQRNRLRVLVYDLTRKGEVVLESDPVVFPSWVITGEAPGHSFKVEGRVYKDTLVLDWQARAWHEGKKKLTAAEADKLRQSAEGLARIDLATGKVEMIPTELASTRIGVVVPEKDLDKKTVRWQGTVNGQFKAILLEQDASGQHAQLAAWDRLGVATGTPRVLKSGKRLAVLASLDERLIGIREILPSPDVRPVTDDKEHYAWSLFSLDTGELVARVAFEPSTQGLVVHGTRLIVVQSGSLVGGHNQPSVSGRSLKAIDMKTGKILWQHAIAGKVVRPPE